MNTLKTNSRIIQYFALMLGAMSLSVALFVTNGWRSDALFHATMEVGGTVLALVVGSLSLMRYYAEKKRMFLFLGVGFIGTAFLDAYHTLVTSRYLDILWPSPPRSLSTWSWVASRFFLALLLLLSWLAARKDPEQYQQKKTNQLQVYFGAVLLCFATFVFFILFPLPRAFYPEYLMTRPQDIIAATVFLMALVGFLRLKDWQTDFFSHTLILFIILSFAIEAFFMSFSNSLHDAMFDTAHAFKIASYFVIFFGLLQDMSLLFRQVEEKNEALRNEIIKRKGVEVQLVQTQKMEAIGQLAGGVAHDFNNQLLVISGFADFLMQEIEKEAPAYKYVQEIKNAGERSEAIVKQLLAFGSKQMRMPRIVDVNKIVQDMGDMLRHLIREDIHFDIQLSPNIGKVKLDPGQLEQVLTNLVLNARDAMPKGGKLSIQTQNSKASSQSPNELRIFGHERFAEILVKDSGEGIEESLKTRIYEPFFTTKRAGEGTGLGLATSYGIVRQNEGALYFESEVGTGTVFHICFPHAEESAELGRMAPSPKPKAASAGGRTILLAEDEESVRTLTASLLESLGYNVLEAESGEDALRKLRGHAGGIDLLISDVIMPEMAGPALALKVRELYPLIKVLFISGYTDNYLMEQGLVDGEYDFLGKPFSKDILEQKLTEILC